MTLNCIRVGIYKGPVVQSPISANPVLTLYVLLIVYPGFNSTNRDCDMNCTRYLPGLGCSKSD